MVNAELVDRLRQAMCDLLQRIQNTDPVELYPRSAFANWVEFYDRLQAALLLLDRADGIEDLDRYVANLRQNRVWAQINDSILAALLLRRPIVLVRPAGFAAAAFGRGHRRWDDRTNEQEIQVFNPNGTMQARSPPSDLFLTSEHF